MQTTGFDNLVPPRKFLRMCRRNMRRLKLADSSGLALSGSRLLSSALVLRSILRRKVAADEQYVGVLLPPSVGAVTLNAALAIDRRIAVNLNYSLSAELVNHCIEQCGIRHVVTSRRMLEKVPLELNAQTIFIEDLKPQATWFDKIAAGLQTWLVPITILERRLRLQTIKSDDLLTVIFTSGSTGQPKGVMLTHGNIGSNLLGIDTIIHLKRDDCMLGILPLFHAFGYTVTMWTVLTFDPQGVYHYSPLEAREIARLCKRHGATILVATPTFLRSFLRRCEPDDLRSLEVVFVGAERLPQELADAFEKRFGVRPTEGYGATELSPVVCGNVPDKRAAPGGRAEAKAGTVGRPMPGLEARVTDLETGETLPAGRDGMIWFRGPGVMKGYLERAELTAEVLCDGWYRSGDVGKVDNDGFLQITGRISRFSKVAGEMVPHLRIEQAIGDILSPCQDHVQLAVLGLPDVARGERLFVFHTGMALPAEEICRRLLKSGIPSLWLPSIDSFRQINALPILASGKLDFSSLQKFALAQWPTSHFLPADNA